MSREVGIEFLNRIERRESELLSWGVVDGFFSADELEGLAESFLDTVFDEGGDCDFDTPAELVEWLEERKLVCRLPGGERYRSRMAESVRLLARLRQLFPGRPWRTAPNLVSDFRLILRPREYPSRSVDPETVAGSLADLELDPLQHEVLLRTLGSGTDRPRRLAAFQSASTRRVLLGVRSRRSTGTIVCAGTGSGKTLAFYLPALMSIAGAIDHDAWTKCLALYPRNELLKDQLREACSQLLRINPVVREAGKRVISVGAFFGDVPNSADQLKEGRRPSYLSSWSGGNSPRGRGLHCPFISCPNPDCGRGMLWLYSDIEKGTERLVCSFCPTTLESDTVRLTRTRLVEAPPDILFTTTEMMNRRMSSSRFGRIFGVGQPRERRPKFVLLDEVHTYEGVHGAHVGLLLRRWRQLSSAAPHFVGLSATLADASRFFADLVGIQHGNVQLIEPQRDAMEKRGMEYLLALRADSASRTSLLSTTIQTAMLLRRMLDPRDGRSKGVYGQKVFAFTDNLDVINRLYHNLLDAEGLTTFGSADREKAGGSLANLRAPDAVEDEHAARADLGQSWDFAEEIGHSLRQDSYLTIGRTSSQDAGVEAAADIIVATASLEVGFDDPTVGAVIQHKAPRDAAAFLQRKGRAGRSRDMRPWTTVVLSDFGRDRFAYQAYDQLFSPSLPPRHLPTKNRYVLRMQATYALLDWFSVMAPGNVDPWSDAAGPPNQWNAHRQQTLRDLCRRILEQDSARASLRQYLQEALGIEAGEVEALLWHPPRPLLMEVVPSLLRRLERGWKMAGSDKIEPHSRAPLPEFAPEALFSDLNLPEVEIVVCDREGNPRDDDTAYMPIAQALSEFAPGRVSRRYGARHAKHAHWVAVEEDAPVDLQSFCSVEDRQPLGHYGYVEDGTPRSVRVFRPYRFHVRQIPGSLAETSNGFLRWHTQIVPSGDGALHALPEQSPWRDILPSVRFHTHSLLSPIELRRFATGSDFSMTTKRGETSRGHAPLVDSAIEGDDLVGMGFAVDVDAVELLVHLPQRLYQRVRENEGLIQGTRRAYFRHRVAMTERLDGVANSFEREAIAGSYLSALITRALNSGSSLEHAAVSLAGAEGETLLRNVLDTVFQAVLDDDSAPAHGRRHAELAALLSESHVRETLHSLAEVLWMAPDATWEPWLRRRFVSTLGTAFLEACRTLCPELDDGELRLELDGGPSRDPRDGSTSIWLTESLVGGAGFVDGFLRRFAEDPRRFSSLLSAALGPSDLEQIDDELRRALDWVAPESPQSLPDIRRLFGDYRAAESHAELAASALELRRALNRSGFQVSHPTVTALHTRILGPGTSPSTDRLVREAQTRWRGAEESLGIEIDPEDFAYHLSQDASLALEGAVPEHADASVASDEHWRFGVLYGLFWPRGAQVRSNALQAYNRFAALPRTDRLLVLQVIDTSVPEVDAEGEEWFSELSERLVSNGVARVSARREATSILRAALLQLAVNPVDAGGLLAYARVGGLEANAGRVSAVVELSEALQ